MTRASRVGSAVARYVTVRAYGRSTAVMRSIERTCVRTIAPAQVELAPSLRSQRNHSLADRHTVRPNAARSHGRSDPCCAASRPQRVERMKLITDHAPCSLEDLE